ncbi:MAG: trypsin-like peptidase domain-containing protein [Mobilitalea sp.]
MKKIQKICLSMIMVLLLSISAPGIGILSTTEIAMAATNSSNPTATVDKVSLYVGYKTYQVKFKNLAKTATVTYKSSNAKIAKVSNKGVITAVAKGSTTVSVTMKQNKKSYTSKIKVTVAVPAIKLTKKTDKLMTGDTYTFAATITGTDSKTTWKVSDTSLASIDTKTGVFKALKKGTVTVTATAGKLKTSSEVTISEPRFTTSSKQLTIYDQTIIYIDAPGIDKDETLNVSADNYDVIDVNWGAWDGTRIPLLINTYSTGTATITIASDKYKEELTINVTVIEEPKTRDKHAKELSANKINNKYAPLTVEIQVSTYDGDYVGSGFFLYSGVIMTNYHVIEGAHDIKVITYNKTEYKVEKILGYDEKLDLAILTIDAVTDHIPLCKDGIEVGEDVYTLGSPRGLTGSLSNGIVSSYPRDIDGVNYVQITAPVSGGNSGGPLLNAYGELIGINTFIILDSQNLNFAVEASQWLDMDLNSPMKADDFYAANEKADEPILVVEDTTKSGNVATAQEIGHRSMVTGSIGGANFGDIYYFKVNESKSVYAYLRVEGIDQEKAFLTIVDAYGNYLISDIYKDETDGSKYAYIEADLPAGEYYIMISSNTDNPPYFTYGFLLRYVN